MGGLERLMVKWVYGCNIHGGYIWIFFFCFKGSWDLAQSTESLSEVARSCDRISPVDISLDLSSLSNQYSTTGITQAVVCDILST